MRTIIGLALAWGVAAHAQTLPAPPTSPAPVRNYEYDAQGNLTRVIQAPGVAGFDLRTTNTYDRLERLKDSTDPKNGVTNLEYDGLDRPTKVTDPKRLITEYKRNGLGDTKQQVSPDTGTTNLTYDAAGNLKSYTDARGVAVTLHYDEISRLKMASYAQTGQTTVYHQWQYDRTDVPHGIGRLGNVLHPAGSWNYSYDAWGNILSNRQQLTAVTGGNAAQLNHTVAYGYDSGNNVASITYPSGRKLTITRDRGAITGMSLAKDAASTPTPLISEVSWAPFGPVKSWKWHLASGTQVHERLYDSWGRPVRYRIGDTIRDLSYDAADRISGYTHYDAATAAATPALNQGFQYDELGRLKHVTLNAGYWGFEYDANGNRTKATASGNTSDYTIQATSNRIASITNPARSFSYDNVGNTTADGNFTATYDLPGRMKTLTKAGVTTTYTYDPEGKRIRKFSSTGAASTVVFVYDQRGHLLGEYDQTGKALREFVWLGDTPVAVFTPDPASATNPPLVYFIHTDHLNAPRVVMDKANKVRWRWIAEPFGVSAAEANPSGLGVFTFNLRFPGQYYEAESGLHDNWWRTYDPNVGRYTTSDPVGLAAGINTYAYVSGNPLTLVDAFGLCPCGSASQAISLARADRRDWSKKADRRDVNSGFGPDTYKCNLFTDTQFEAAGYHLPNIGGSSLSKALGLYPPGAKSLSDPSYTVDGWPVVSGPALPGDLLAEKGHVGIAVGNGISISASPSGVVENNWGSRPGQTTVIRRCTCPASAPPPSADYVAP